MVIISAPLIVTADVRADLAKLREAAALKPVDVVKLIEALKTPAGRQRHQQAMKAQTVVIRGPFDFFVTFSIETGHPAGTCRHMSMSILRKGRVPHPLAVWMVCQELGFSGGLEACRVWPEDLSDGGTAINVVQPVAVAAAATDAPLGSAH